MMASVTLAALTWQFKYESDSCTSWETYLQVLALGQMELEQEQVQALAWVPALGQMVQVQALAWAPALGLTEA